MEPSRADLPTYMQDAWQALAELNIATGSETEANQSSTRSDGHKTSQKRQKKSRKGKKTKKSAPDLADVNAAGPAGDNDAVDGYSSGPAQELASTPQQLKHRQLEHRHREHHQQEHHQQDHQEHKEQEHQEQPSKSGAEMTDRLTQIQDCLDQLATQMFASIHYVSSHHPASNIPGQPSRRLATSTTAADTAGKNEANTPGGGAAAAAPAPAPATPSGEAGEGDGEEGPDDPTTFAATLRELSRDLVIKEQQIEFLINSLPGIKTSRDEQEERLRALQAELEALDGLAVKAASEKEQLVEQIEELMLMLKRVY